jgi:hypothetical protein
MNVKRLERQILRERVDQILVGDGRREPRLGAAALDRGNEQRLEPVAVTP